MPADKCYCRPNRDPLPRWPCEDASTAFKLCCLSATIYDVRCWGVQGDRDRYVDYSPGDVVGQKLVRYAWSGSPFEGDRSETQFTINCDAGDLYPNTNLRGDVLFMFPDPDVNPDGFDLQDAVNPWLPCPCIQTELRDRDSGLYYATLKTWVGVSWSYSCDTGLVSFRAVWGGWAGNDIYPWQEYYLLVNQLAGKEAVTTADPDWYLDNEITIPYATENDTNRLSRFSVKLKMTCEAEPPECEVQDPCAPCPCMASSSGTPIEEVFYDLTIQEDDLILLESGVLTRGGGEWQWLGDIPVTLRCVGGNGEGGWELDVTYNSVTYTMSIAEFECNGNNIVDVEVIGGGGVVTITVILTTDNP